MTVTVGINSYISSTDADAYFAARLYADDWTNANDGVKEKALLMARRLIDQQEYLGWRTLVGQMLAWPRMGISCVPSDSVPFAILDAQCELALAFIRRDLTLDDKKRGVKRLREQVGPLTKETEYDGRAPSRELPDIVAALLRPFFSDAESTNSVQMKF
jgi:hypothetical protein